MPALRPHADRRFDAARALSRDDRSGSMYRPARAGREREALSRLREVCAGRSGEPMMPAAMAEDAAQVVWWRVLLPRLGAFAAAA
jgi:hypothetical protein